MGRPPVGNHVDTDHLYSPFIGEASAIIPSSHGALLVVVDNFAEQASQRLICDSTQVYINSKGRQYTLGRGPMTLPFYQLQLRCVPSAEWFHPDVHVKVPYDPAEKSPQAWTFWKPAYGPLMLCHEPKFQW